MSVNKLAIILFSSFLMFAMAPLTSAQSYQQDQKKQTTQKSTTTKDAGKTTEKQSTTTAEKKTATEKKAPAVEKKTQTTEKKVTTQKAEPGKTGAKQAKKTSSLSKDKVREVQTALKQEGFDPGPIDGIMGPMTMSALRNYQSRNNLEVTGTLSAETENKLMHGRAATTKTSEYESEYSTRESLGVSSHATVSSVEDVKRIQQALTDLMYNPGEINGMMSSQTQQAIREFQYLNNLSVTGIVDEQTQIALDTQWRGGVENAQLTQTPFAERAKPQPEISSESQQTRTDTYSKDQTTTKDNTYKQDRTDHSTTAVQSHSTTTTTDHDRYNKDRDKDVAATDRDKDKTREHATTGKMDKDAADRVSKAAAVLQDLTASADKRVPNELLQRAEAIAVIPHMIKGAFGIGGRYGKGVVAQRAENGRWSPPAFISIGGGSFGAQIGATSTDLVLVFTDRKALSLLEGGKDLKLGVDAGIVAGPIGREAEAGVNANLASAIYAYSRSKGLFAGVALDGAVLDMDNDTNHRVYGDSVDAKQILEGKMSWNATVRPFMDALDKVVPKKRISQK